MKTKNKDISEDILRYVISSTKHKCHSIDCNNQTDTIWCNKCLDELGEHIEKHPLGYVPKRIK